MLSATYLISSVKQYLNGHDELCLYGNQSYTKDILIKETVDVIVSFSVLDPLLVFGWPNYSLFSPRSILTK